jgi:hypothetical protein
MLVGLVKMRLVKKSKLVLLTILYPARAVKTRVTPSGGESRAKEKR